MTSGVPIESYRTALIVDDLRFNRSLLRHSLASLHFTTTEAADGIAAIEQLNRTRFDIVFLDWELPGMIKGDEVAAHLRAQRPRSDTLLIAITSDTSDAMRQRCALAFTDAFLGKQLDAFNVKNAIASAAAGLSFSHIKDDHLIAMEMIAGYACHFPGTMPEVLAHYRDEFHSEHRKLCAAVSAGLRDDAARTAHNLGALTAIIGLSMAREACKRCEHALREGNPAQLPAVLAEIERIVLHVCTVLTLPEDPTQGPVRTNPLLKA